MTTKVSERPTQLQCVTVVAEKTCNHPKSFHGKKKPGRNIRGCMALGCKCTRWTEPTP